ncbi:MAG: ABC transporter ATP-binding protein, partial [Lactococcus sp.]|nr:ABC transporter ATP-binding protein [Lactococcus sp.]
MDSIKWVWQYAKVYRWRIVLAVLLVAIVSALSIIFPLLGGELVDVVIDQGKTEWLLPILGGMIGITVFRIILRYAYQILFEVIGQNTLYKIREDLYVKLQEMDFGFFNQTRVGDIMARMTGDTDAIRHFVS